MDRLDQPEGYLPDIWATHARFSPHKEAIICGDQRVSWAEFSASLNKVANRLTESGIGRGDKVAVVMNNSADILIVMYGIVCSGACVVPISTLLTPEQMGTLVRDCGAGALFADETTHGAIDTIRTSLTGISQDRFILHGANKNGWTPLDTWLKGASTARPTVAYSMQDPFNITYSSGTTGLPKGIVQSHRARHHWSYSNAIEMRFDNRSRALTTTALYSNGTWLMVLPALFAGGTVVALEEFSPQAFLSTVEKERITHSFMVPTQYIVTLEDGQPEEYDLSSVKTLLSAGSPLRIDTKAEARRRITPNIYELYGYTEGFATLLKPEFSDARPGSVGTPVLGFEMEIIDDDGRVVARGEVGEIVGTGAGVMSEYHNRPQATAESIWRDGRGRSFIRSGDMGRQDENGFLYIVGRKKDMIISGGFNVFPADIEAIIAGHENVSDVSVIGVPHPKWGEVPVAFIIRRAGAPANRDILRDWANERLAKTQRLHDVRFCDEFPRNVLGKVMKAELLESYFEEDPA